MPLATNGFRCEFCRKFYMRESFCLIHESDCFRNPANIQICVECNHLEVSEREYSYYGYHEEYAGKTKRFRCSKLNVDLHSRQLEKKRAFTVDEYFMDTVRMKQKCEYFEQVDILKQVVLIGAPLTAEEILF